MVAEGLLRARLYGQWEKFRGSQATAEQGNGAHCREYGVEQAPRWGQIQLGSLGDLFEGQTPELKNLKKDQPSAE